VPGRRPYAMLAWRVFGFERQYITALARNQSPGMMAGKLGLAAERACRAGTERRRSVRADA
jgi:hypothetical protein